MVSQEPRAEVSQEEVVVPQEPRAEVSQEGAVVSLEPRVEVSREEGAAVSQGGGAPVSQALGDFRSTTSQHRRPPVRCG